MVESADGPNASPGEILRGARELYGWSLDEVAAELNLLPDVVEALEADDYRDIAGWTYAVGYLRNYARLAGVSIDQAISDRRDLLPPREDGPGTMTEGTSQRPQPVPIQYRWVVTAVVLLLVVGGLYAAFLNRASDVERLRVDLAEESRSQEDAGTEASDAIAVTEKPEEVLAQPALAVTLTTTDGDDTSDLKAATSGVTTIAEEEKRSEEGPAPLTDAKTLADSSAPVAAQVTAPAAEPNEKPAKTKKEEKKEKKKTITAAATTAKVSEPKVEKKSKSGSKSSSSSKTKTAEKASTTKSKQQAANQKQSSAAVQQRLLNPEFSTALSSTGDSDATATTLPLTSDSRGITVKVQENTHVVVWDRDNVELFRRYVGGGKVVSLSGKPPFTLLVSYPEGATVVYGGREFRIPVGKSGRNAKVRVGR